MKAETPAVTAAVPELGRLEVYRAEARSILGRIAERTFATLEASGVIVPVRRGRGGRKSVYALEIVVPAYLAYVGSQRPASDRDARARRDLAVAELNELRVQKERGDLVARQPVVADGQGFTRALTAKIRAVPRRARQAGIVTDAVQEAALAALCRDIQIEIAAWRTLADLQSLIEEIDAAGDNPADEATS